MQEIFGRPNEFYKKNLFKKPLSRANFLNEALTLTSILTNPCSASAKGKQLTEIANNIWAENVQGVEIEKIKAYPQRYLNKEIRIEGHMEAIKHIKVPTNLLNDWTKKYPQVDDPRNYLIPNPKSNEYETEAALCELHTKPLDSGIPFVISRINKNFSLNPIPFQGPYETLDNGPVYSYSSKKYYLIGELKEIGKTPNLKDNYVFTPSFITSKNVRI